jgi:hypothetical protein
MDEEEKEIEEDFNIPWPQKGDELFKADKDWWHNACLNFSLDMSIGYVYGYKKAADILVEYIKHTQRDHDYLVYPIVFLYRHHLELIIKKIIKDGNQLLDIINKVPKHHKIKQLWDNCKTIVQEVWPEGSSDDLDAVEQCLNQFNEIDQTSIGFRYPTDKQGNPTISGIKHINLRNLAEVMERISSFFEGVDTGISENLSHKCEMEAYYSSEY